MIIDPLGNVVLQAKEYEEGILRLRLILKRWTEERGQIPVFEDRRTDLYY